MKKLLTIFILTSLSFLFLVTQDVLAATVKNPIWDQKHFRFRNDDGSQTTATWKANEDTNLTGHVKNTVFRLRIETVETNTQTAGTNVTPLIQYKAAAGGACTDASGWTIITTSTANIFALSLSGNFVDKAATTQQLTGIGGYSFVAGEILESSNPATALTFSKKWTEHEWNLVATTNAADGTAYLLRASNFGGSYNVYTVCPQITINAAPSAPTQNLPINNATSVSITPTFTMTSTDSNSDYLGYKVVIYSDSACTSVVQTNDQSASSTGWSSMDQTCTNSPTSCYASGTQATFVTQTSLSNGTDYWWRASSKDPDGSGAFTGSGLCNKFTTIAGATVSVTLNTDGIVAYGILGQNVQKSTIDLTDTQTVKNDGNVPEDFSIKTSVATGGTGWTLGSSAGTNIFVHEFSSNGGGAWTKFITADTYSATLLATNVAVNGTQNFDLRITSPTSSDSVQKSITITILATENLAM